MYVGTYMYIYTQGEIQVGPMHWGGGEGGGLGLCTGGSYTQGRAMYKGAIWVVLGVGVDFVALLGLCGKHHFNRFVWATVYH